MGVRKARIVLHPAAKSFMRSQYTGGQSAASLAKEYNVTVQTVYNILGSLVAQRTIAKYQAQLSAVPTQEHAQCETPDATGTQSFDGSPTTGQH